MARIIDITPRSRDIQPVLMLLTSHRLDCFLLCVKCLELYTDLSRFKKIYVVANAVSDEHAVIIKSFQQRHRGVIDVHVTPRGLIPAVVSMQNFILARHVDDVIVRLSEDVFVTPNWLDHLLAAYKLHRGDDSVPLASCVTPVSRTGRQVMDRALRAHFPDERSRLPHLPMEANAVYHRFVWEKILHHGLVEKYLDLERPRHVYLGHISVDCVMFDRRLMDAVVPIPMRVPAGVGRVDEFHINGHLRTTGRRAVVATDAVVHHFSHSGPEAFLRRHVSLDDIWWYMTFLQDSPAYRVPRAFAARRPAGSGIVAPRLVGRAAPRPELLRLLREREMRVLK
ncbi:glycosyltransferase family 2 protein [Desulfocurvus sp.]|jgi:hypothetical protein|uniref:glycosyltransferase family 2 protein n=1 Tax=Desulfocurvus sp. TaxID=2871698 RepID=UPI0025BE147D|nr:glycosyltransferase family 2 protein [Desulfocurvus sp.]MCK9240769.1 glycosyltransferase family 2 protein [Desulfocurvus sp.]